jgi:hypothetical protein
VTRLLRVLCAALVAVLGTLGFAATSVSAAPATGGSTMVPGRHDPLHDPNQRLSVSITTFSPRVATPDTKKITVARTVRNVGDRDISNLDVRLQAGNAIRADSRMMSQLTTPADPQKAASRFTRFRRRLAPGQSARFSVTVRPGSLGITRHGIYPLQLNVNGRPKHGGTARLLAVNLLLPVQAKPAANANGPGVGMLWPLVGDHPRLLGTTGGQALLADDGLARSLRPGGRLYRLVDSAKAATAAHPELGRALCFAIDPELLNAVNAMAHGYRVRNPGGGTRAGAGQNAATAWLAELRGVTKNRCVVSLPYADADLVSLTRAGAPALARRALHQHVVADLLPRAHILPNVLWPAGGRVDHRTLAAVSGKPPVTVLADPQALRGSGSAGPLPVGGSGGAHALRIDPLVSTALGGLPTHEQPASTSPGSLAPGLLPATAVPGVRAQNGVAALVYRADSESGEPALIAPPRRWRAGGAGLTAFLDTLAGLFSSGSAHPVRLGELASAPPRGQPVALDYSPQAAASEMPPGVTTKIVHSYRREEDLRSAMSKDSARTETPAGVMTPVVRGLLRADSTAWRSVPVARRQGVVDDARSTLASIIGKVTVHDPGRPISLASDASRIPVSVSNGLPVDVKVHISLQKAGGLKAQPIPDPVIPARSGRTLYVPTKVLRSGWLSIDVVLSTPGGMQLGSPARLRLRSSAYGTITLAVTGTAFALLVLLAGRRIYRRVRAARAGPDGHTGPEQEDSSGAPSPDEPSGADVTRHDDRGPSAVDAEPVTAPIARFGDEGHAAGSGPQLRGPSRDGQ